MGHIEENLQLISQRMQQALQQAGRAPQSVQLLAVSKTFAAEDIAEAVACGQAAFGENRLQELLEKKADARLANVAWHLIGPLQSNKIRKAVSAGLARIDAVHNLKTALGIERISEELGLQTKILLEVELGDEASKSGFKPHELPQVLEQLCACKHIELQGLMCIPPAVEQAAEARRYFSQLRQLAEQARSYSGLALGELSMGMSHDYYEAILEGSTCIRVGSAIFGRR